MDDDSRLDDELLAAMGLDGLQGEEKQDALRSILNTLNIKVGQRMVEQFTDEQSDEFERLTRPGSDPEKLAYWIALNVPNHKELIEEEAQKLRSEAVDFADEMMQKSQTSQEGTDNN